MKIHIDYFGVICTVIALFLMYSCTKDFEDINTKKSAIMSVGAGEYAELFTSAIENGLGWSTTDDMSRMSSTLAMHNAGYTACGMPTYDEYLLGLGWENSGFKDIYVSALPPLFAIIDNAKAAGDSVPYSVAQIWKVFLFDLATDVWGPIPYSEACSGKEAVPYDSQKDVYYMMFDDLSNAVRVLNNALKVNPDLTIFVTAGRVGDLIYSGEVAKWAKFGNTLHLRLAMRISNVEPDKAKTEAEAAVEAGSMLEINDDNAFMDVSNFSGNGNGMPRMESFYQDVMSTNMESVLKGYKDPRMQEFWSPVEANSTNQAFPASYKKNIGQYKGFPSGANSSQYKYFKAYSKYGPRFVDGKQLVTPINVMHASEAYFLKAEGAWRGWNMGGTAQEFYEEGISLSIKQWRGTAISDDSIQKYINSTLVPIAPDDTPYYDSPMATIPVKFSTNSDEQYEQIITQKWLALFPLCFEAWAEFRRTRLPKLYAKKYSVNPNIDPTNGQILTRCPFVNDEVNANAAEVDKAALLITGGVDIENAPLWWDVHSNTPTK